MEMSEAEPELLVTDLLVAMALLVLPMMVEVNTARAMLTMVAA